jgi:hypothetical protein
MESVFDVAQQFADVLASDGEASLLGIVQLPRVSRPHDLRF